MLGRTFDVHLLQCVGTCEVQHTCIRLGLTNRNAQGMYRASELVIWLFVGTSRVGDRW